MREETSAGGVILFGNAVLLLKKYNGDWVLPKGKIEKGETLEQTAMREVYEESGIKAKIIKYIGEIQYNYKGNWEENDIVNKTVHWFLMESRTMNSIPLKEEGFIQSKFIHINRCVEMARYEDERNIIKKAIEEYR